MVNLFEAYCRIYRRNDSICDFCGKEIKKGKAMIIDRYQCHLSCYAKKYKSNK